jgi:hypothetical protein
LQDRAAARVDLGSVVTADIADEFNAHGLSLSSRGWVPPPGRGSVMLVHGRGRDSRCKMPFGSNLIIKI